MNKFKFPSNFLILMVIGILLFSFFILFVGPEFVKSRFQEWKITEPGQVGDVFGGTMGPLIAWLAAILTFAAFWVQYTANEQQKKDLNDQREAVNLVNFENRFFELINLHRDNVNEMQYVKTNFNSGSESYVNRGVMKIIFKEFIECYREVKKFSNSKDPLDYFTKKHLANLEKIKSSNNIKANAIEMAIIDISYSIVFFGVEAEGEAILRERFLSRYNNLYYFRLLAYIKLKPKESSTQQYENWQDTRKLPLKNLRELVNEIYENRKHISPSIMMSPLSIALIKNDSEYKYYSGHQDRLGHYFRHLYQSFKYLNSVDFLDEDKKYSHGKTLRAQLSTYEQALLFINSISSIGMNWEYTFEPKSTTKLEGPSGLITEYNLIKNLPGKHFFGITYKDYYPRVKYERLNKNL